MVRRVVAQGVSLTTRVVATCALVKRDGEPRRKGVTAWRTQLAPCINSGICSRLDALARVFALLGEPGEGLAGVPGGLGKRGAAGDAAGGGKGLGAGRAGLEGEGKLGVVAGDGDVQEARGEAHAPGRDERPSAKAPRRGAGTGVARHSRSACFSRPASSRPAWMSGATSAGIMPSRCTRPFRAVLPTARPLAQTKRYQPSRMRKGIKVK